MTKYVLAELIFSADMPVKHGLIHVPWTDSKHKRIQKVSETIHSHASEGGFCLPISPRDRAANRLMAAQRGVDYYEYQPLRDFRFNYQNGTRWKMRMKDSMPWTERELNKLVAAILKEVNVVAEIVVKSFVIVDDTSCIDV